MEQSLQVFKNEEFKWNVRVVLDENGNRLFCLKDVCECLKISDHKKVGQRLDDDEIRGVKVPSSNGYHKAETMLFITEPGLFRVLGSSKSPVAKPFQRWLYHEVLPSIAKTGYYVPKINPDDIMGQFKALLEGSQKMYKMIEEKNAVIKVLEPLADFAENYLDKKSGLTTSEIGVKYGFTAQKFNHKLKELKILKHCGNSWLITAKHMNKGYHEVEVGVNKSNFPYRQIKWTIKGELFLYNLLKEEGIKPKDKVYEARLKRLSLFDLG